MSHVTQFLAEAKQIIDGLDTEAIDRMVSLLEANSRTSWSVIHPGRRR